jgi:hypothetical protein
MQQNDWWAIGLSTLYVVQPDAACLDEAAARRMLPLRPLRVRANLQGCGCECGGRGCERDRRARGGHVLFLMSRLWWPALRRDGRMAPSDNAAMQ